jgi:hypothetical protein
VRELSVGAVDLAPGLEQVKDRRDFLRAQAVHRVAARALVIQVATVTPAPPPRRPTLIKLQIRAGAAVILAVGDRPIDLLSTERPSSIINDPFPVEPKPSQMWGSQTRELWRWP